MKVRIRLGAQKDLPAVAETVVDGIDLRVVVDDHDGRRAVVQTGFGDGSLISVPGDASGEAELPDEFLVKSGRTLRALCPVLVLRAFVVSQHHLRSVLLNHAEGVIDVLLGRILLRHTETQDVLAHHPGRYHMQPTRRVNVSQQLLIHLLTFLQSEAHQSDPHVVQDLEASVFLHVRLEPLSQSYVIPNVLLQAGDTVQSHNEPELQCSKSSTERDTPVTIVNRLARTSVLKIKRIDDQR